MDVTSSPDFPATMDNDDDFTLDNLPLAEDLNFDNIWADLYPYWNHNLDTPHTIDLTTEARDTNPTALRETIDKSTQTENITEPRATTSVCNVDMGVQTDGRHANRVLLPTPEIHDIYTTPNATPPLPQSGRRRSYRSPATHTHSKFGHLLLSLTHVHIYDLPPLPLSISSLLSPSLVMPPIGP